MYITCVIFFKKKKKVGRLGFLGFSQIFRVFYLAFTIADDLGGAPFGNVVSFSDGLPDKGTGVTYFYLTTLDPTARYALKDHRSSFTISEYPLGTCGKADPENPTCSKITLTGKLNEVDAKSKEATTAKNWPKDHNFQVFKLDIEEIFLINYFGGPKPLTVDQYFHAGK
ncbi:putative FMN-binding split barrel [Helianthus annuus]|nr:putative FMN-binding split barrel [Helianthus annuus]KAJ0635984.1 putative FMN-binding split barrel [Helianthus annuus]